MKLEEKISEYHKKYQSYGWSEVKYKDLTENELKGFKQCLSLLKYPTATVMYVPYDRYLIL